MLESIAITTPPTKTAYVAGETFDASGMIVTATYSDASTAAVTGYSVSPSGSLTTNDTTITVSYTEDGVTATATVEIIVSAQPNIIASGDFWTLYDTGLLDIHCNGDMPDYSAGVTYAPWYDYRSQITSATLQNGVTSVGDGAFVDCSSLTSITVPGSVTNVGDHAFDGCSALTSVTIPGSVTSIEGAAFRDCSGLTGVTIPNSVTSIGGQAFSGCAALASVTISNGVTSIGFSTFNGCGNLTSVTIPSGVSSIGQSAFYKCRRLASVMIPVSVASIGNYAFDDCESIGDVYYGGTETQWGAVEIGNYNAPLTSATIHYTEAPTPEPEPTPEPVAAGRINYTGQSKVIRRLCATVNDLYAARPRLFVDEDGYISVEYEEANNGE